MLSLGIEAVGVKSDYHQDGGRVRFCYDYRVNARLKNCVVCRNLRVIGSFMYIWNDYTHKMMARGKKADDFYSGNFTSKVAVNVLYFGKT